jgi:hypothetical protein
MIERVWRARKLLDVPEEHPRNDIPPSVVRLYIIDSIENKPKPAVTCNPLIAVHTLRIPQR